jgi:tRNA(Ile)-lysidine synthase
MFEKISRFIEKHKLLKQDGCYLVALSGGADSVALLLVLRKLGYMVEAVHCNFRLRGDEANRDEQFCVALCEREQVKLHRVHFDTREYATQHRVSIEMAARDLRYGYFEQLRKDLGFDGICVAHHQDDQVETVLMNIIRGTGLHGLTGMAPVNGNIIRPLLCVSRMEIEEWLKFCHQSFVVDSTNLKDDVVRNKIRLDIIPALNDINPCASGNILKMSQRMIEVEKVVSTAVVPMHEMLVEEIMRQPSPLYVLYMSLKDYGFNSAQIEQIADMLPGKTGRFWCSATHQLLFDRGRILVEPLQEKLKQIVMPETGTYVCDENTKISLEIVEWRADSILFKDKSVAMLDAGKVTFPLTLRPVQKGDRFFPFGMKGSKLVSDYLTDRKKSLFDRQRQMVVEDARGQIIWVVNERPSEQCRITSQTVQTIIIKTL